MEPGLPDIVDPDRSISGPARRWSCRRGRLGWWVTPYVLVSAIAVLGAVVLSVRQPWGADFGLHAAAVGRLRDNPLHPGNPMVEVDLPGPYATPYTLVLGLVARLTGAPAAAVLSAAAPINLALLLYGLRRFVGLFAADRWTPVVALVNVLSLWGTEVLRWSGFPTLHGLVLILPYPSTLALGLLLIGWAELARGLVAPTPSRWAGLGLLGGLLVLVHPFTALGAALGAVALLAGRLRRPARVMPIGVLFGVGVALLVVLSWPYFRVTQLLASAGGWDDIHRPLYTDPVASYGFAFAVGLPALALRLRRDRLDPLVLLFGLTGAAVLVGGLTGGYALGRLWPMVLLSLQVAAATELVRALGQRRWVGPLTALWAVTAVVASLAGLAIAHGNLLLVLPADRLTAERRTVHRISTLPDYSWVGRVVGRDAVLLTDDRSASRELLAYEIRAVAPPWPDPLLREERQRRADQATLLDPRTPDPLRRDLLTRYGVDWVLDPRDGYRWLDRYGSRRIDGPGRARLVRLSTID